MTISRVIGVDEQLLDVVHRDCWQPALDGDGRPRDGAEICELTGLLAERLSANGWPPGLRVITRRERPHPGAQLRLADRHGWRITLFATNAPSVGGLTLQALVVCDRRRGHAEHRVRDLKDTGLGRLPFQTREHNQLWADIALLACDLLAWTALLGLDQHRAAQPKTLRLRLLGAAARLVTSGRRRVLKARRRLALDPRARRGPSTARRAAT